MLVRLHLIFRHRVEGDARLGSLGPAEAGIVVELPIHEKQVRRGRLSVGAVLTAFERAAGCSAGTRPGMVVMRLN